MDFTEGASASTWFKPHIEDKSRSARGKYSMRTRVIIIVVGSLLSWSVVLLPIVAFGHEYVLVGTEFDTEYLPRFQKWSGVLERHRAGPIATGRSCAGGVEGACAGPTWLAFLDKLETDALSEQLIQVNRYVNEIQYMQDVANWGESDHWAAPAEFFANGGDCEDYAIAKYFLLRELGVPFIAGTWGSDRAAKNRCVARSAATADPRGSDGHAGTPDFGAGQPARPDRAVA
jgi:transglutaminase-like putative cysteine protease